jgi:beta-aspartyl-peptidase (threonine type)
VAIPAILVHGGAGAPTSEDDERREPRVRGVERAARVGWERLAGGGSALDAVEAAVRELEDDPEFNAGYGSVLNRLGIVEVDACIMDGELRAGAVAAVPWMRHPITLARKLLERGDHLLLCGGGAMLYARELGIAADPPDTMISPRSKARHEKAQTAGVGDTVGAVAIDAQGRLASATSTGGTPEKRPGRVGDSPVPGAGCMADARAGAASATGHGESILRVGMCRSAIEALKVGRTADEAVRFAVDELVSRTGGDAGLILVDARGRIAHHTSTPRMPWAAVVGGEPSSGAER